MSWCDDNEEVDYSRVPVYTSMVNGSKRSVNGSKHKSSVNGSKHSSGETKSLAVFTFDQLKQNYQIIVPTDVALVNLNFFAILEAPYTLYQPIQNDSKMVQQSPKNDTAQLHTPKTDTAQLHTPKNDTAQLHTPKNDTAQLHTPKTVKRLFGKQKFQVELRSRKEPPENESEGLAHTDGLKGQQHAYIDGSKGQKHAYTDGSKGQQHAYTDGSKGQKHAYTDGSKGQKHAYTDGSKGQKHAYTDGSKGQKHVKSKGQKHAYTEGSKVHAHTNESKLQKHDKSTYEIQVNGGW